MTTGVPEIAKGSCVGVIPDWMSDTCPQAPAVSHGVGGGRGGRPPSTHQKVNTCSVSSQSNIHSLEQLTKG